MDEEKSRLLEAVAHWSLRYFENEMLLSGVTDEEERKELLEQKEYVRELLFKALGEYDRKYSLGPFVVPQETKPVTAPKDPLDMNYLNVKNKIQC